MSPRRFDFQNSRLSRDHSRRECRPRRCEVRQNAAGSPETPGDKRLSTAGIDREVSLDFEYLRCRSDLRAEAFTSRIAGHSGDGSGDAAAAGADSSADQIGNERGAVENEPWPRMV
jgi:hypothetical protein